MGFFSGSSWKGKLSDKGGLPKCGQCGLSKNCYSPKMEPHKGSLDVLFVGEFPGDKDDRTGRHFVGDGGELLRNLVEDVGYDLDECHLTNTIICHPETFHPKQIQYCKPNIKNTINKLKPNVIFTMGTAPLQSLIAEEYKKSIDQASKWTGWMIPSPSLNAWVCPIAHPTYIMQMRRDEVLLDWTRKHLTQGFKIRNRPQPLDVKDLESQVEIIIKPKLAYERLKDLNKKTGIMAFDYETTGKKPDNEAQEIVSCSFCFEGEDTFAFPWHPKLIKIMKTILQNGKLRKVASNLKFEERWSMAKVGTRVNGWHWDTMLAAHQMDNRPKVTSLKFIAYVLLGVIDYDSHIEGYLKAENSNGLNRIKEINMRDLLVYNGMDSLLEFKVMEEQQRIMNW